MAQAGHAIPVGIYASSMKKASKLEVHAPGPRHCSEDPLQCHCGPCFAVELCASFVIAPTAC
eukprot:1635862-Amphidinium_carterae.3